MTRKPSGSAKADWPLTTPWRPSHSFYVPLKAGLGATFSGIIIALCERDYRIAKAFTNKGVSISRCGAIKW